MFLDKILTEFRFFRSVFFNQYDGLPEQEFKPRYAAVVAEGSPGSGARTLLPGLFSLLLAYFLTIVL